MAGSCERSSTQHTVHTARHGLHVLLLHTLVGWKCILQSSGTPAMLQLARLLKSTSQNTSVITATLMGPAAAAARSRATYAVSASSCCCCCRCAARYAATHWLLLSRLVASCAGGWSPAAAAPGLAGCGAARTSCVLLQQWCSAEVDTAAVSCNLRTSAANQSLQPTMPHSSGGPHPPDACRPGPPLLLLVLERQQQESCNHQKHAPAPSSCHGARCGSRYGAHACAANSSGCHKAGVAAGVAQLLRMHACDAAHAAS